jgi:hypothetical protein
MKLSFDSPIQRIQSNIGIDSRQARSGVHTRAEFKMIRSVALRTTSLAGQACRQIVRRRTEVRLPQRPSQLSHVASIYCNDRMTATGSACDAHATINLTDHQLVARRHREEAMDPLNNTAANSLTTPAPSRPMQVTRVSSASMPGRMQSC